MTYPETLDFLYNQLAMYQRQGKTAFKANLDNTHALDTYFGQPHHSFKTIHVAGTNGKGSCAHMLAAVLQAAGYRVGLYTSPHLLDFRERIRVNGQLMAEQDVVDFVAQHKAVFEQLKPSFFEMTVAFAFDYFRRQQVDVAVVEVGLGGRLDSTNIITPVVSVITNIGLDHVDILGHDLKTIAGEKAGIIKKNIPLVVGRTQPETKAVFRAKASALSCPIVFADQQYTLPYALLSLTGKQVFNVHKAGAVCYAQLELDLLGRYQHENLLTVLATLDVLQEHGFCIATDSLRSGLSQVSRHTGMQGRWQVLAENPKIICDTAHNADGLKQVVAQLKNTAYDKLHVVFGMVSDKDVESVLALLPQQAHYYFAKASVPRALSEQVLFELAQRQHLSGRVFGGVAQALSQAKKAAQANDLIFVGGSTFVVADALHALQA